MPKTYFSDEIFKGIDFTKEDFETADYEFCQFINCKLPKVNLGECGFIECEFKGCDLSMAKLVGTSIRDSKFTECKLIGLQFDTCNNFAFSARFESCNLNLSSFFQVKGNHTVFKDCQLNEVDFTQSELKEATFDNCDLAKATFSSTLLKKTDFRSSYNFSIDPEANQIEGAKFSRQGLPGLLDRYGIVIE